jgi:hypothetical protein
LDDDEDSNKEVLPIDTPPGNQDAIEYKRGYLVRKCTHEFGGKKSKRNVIYFVKNRF